MDNNLVKQMLLQAAEQLKDIAERLRPFGKPLNQKERMLCRAAMLPAVQGICEGVQMDFLNGTTISEDLVRAINEMQVY